MKVTKEEGLKIISNSVVVGEIKEPTSGEYWFTYKGIDYYLI